jgi:hypothetical protein
MTNAITRRLPIVLVATAFAGCAAAAQSGERQNTAVSKQQVLWEKLGDEVREVDKSLDGVMGVAIEDLAKSTFSTKTKYFLRPAQSRSPYSLSFITRTRRPHRERRAKSNYLTLTSSIPKIWFRTAILCSVSRPG